MLKFMPIKIEDRDDIDNVLLNSWSENAEYSFINNYIWSNIYYTEYCIYMGYYIAKFEVESKIYFLYPKCAKESELDLPKLKLVIDEILNYCKKESIKKIYLTSLSETDRDNIIKIYDEKFKIVEDRDSFDYIYLAEDLANLKGKKYHAKRNHVNRFIKNNWGFEMINESNIHLCRELNQQWYADKEDSSDDKTDLYGMKKELEVLDIVLSNYFDIGFKGAILKMDDKIVAYTIGSKLNSNAFNIHFEKAISNITGTYATINQEFAKYIFKNNYKYINREEDLGIEMLRKAKLSYYPAYLLKKFNAEIVG